ncbi:MAG TPA: hypothetical protein VIQ74_12915 [Gemmatimonadaceae bacterium]
MGWQPVSIVALLTKVTGGAHDPTSTPAAGATIALWNVGALRDTRGA